MIQFLEGKYKKIINRIWTWSLRGLLCFVFYLIAVNYNLLWLFGGMPSLKELENPQSQLASVLYSEDGVELGKYFRENRSPVEFEELSPNIINALLATEDVRFSKHSGIDLRSTFRVITSFGGAGGGSTITQQLAKNLFDTRHLEEGDDENQYKGFLMKIPKVSTIIAKTKEWILAIRLEGRYTKQEILKMYLNEVEFGNNAYGIRVACKTYFAKDVNNLSVSEAAMLIGMLQNPDLYDPRRRPEKCLIRRNVVLGQMYRYGFLPQSEALALMDKPLGLNYTLENHNTGDAPYFREAIKKQLQAILKDLNSTRGENDQLNLYTSGLKIYTTIDSRMQRYAQDALYDHMRAIQAKFYEHWKGRNPWVDENMHEIKGFLKDAMKRTPRYKQLMNEFGGDETKVWEVLRKPVPMTVFSWEGEKDVTMSPMDSMNYYKRILNCGFTAMNPNDGHVKAWVGGINFKYFKFDHVRQSKRQPGSTFKPFVYAAAIESDVVTPCDNVTDQPITFGASDGIQGTWTPHNSNGRYSYASMPLRRALGLSINTVSAYFMKRLGPEKIAEFAHRMGITSELQETPALCLGASEVSVFEQVAAYCTFANEGYRIDPIMIIKIVDKHGNELKRFGTTTKQVTTAGTAYKMTQLLRGAILEPGGTAEGLDRNWNCAKDNEMGAKTGTTSNYSDGWFMGLTQNLVTGVWVGGDDRSIHFRTIALGQGAKMAMPAFANFMDKVYADKTLELIGYKKEPFKKPENAADLGCYSGRPTTQTVDVPQAPTPEAKEDEEGFLK